MQKVIAAADASPARASRIAGRAAGQSNASPSAGARPASVSLAMTASPKVAPASRLRRQDHPERIPAAACSTIRPPSTAARVSLVTWVPFSSSPGSVTAAAATAHSRRCSPGRRRRTSSMAMGASSARSRAFSARTA